jgi:chromosome segregation ATPase
LIDPFQKITAQADVANQERENLEALCRNIEEENKEKSNLLRQLQTEVDEEKEAVRKQRETLCKELAEVVQSKEKMEKMQNQQVRIHGRMARGVQGEYHDQGDIVEKEYF